MSLHYASGDWTVKAGKEEEFIRAWAEFGEWTKATSPGLEAMVLIRGIEEPRHFVSYSIWDEPASRSAWKGLEEFQEHFARCVALCDDFRGGDYVLTAAPATVF